MKVCKFSVPICKKPAVSFFLQKEKLEKMFTIAERRNS